MEHLVHGAELAVADLAEVEHVALLELVHLLGDVLAAAAAADGDLAAARPQLIAGRPPMMLVVVVHAAAHATQIAVA